STRFERRHERIAAVIVNRIHDAIGQAVHPSTVLTEDVWVTVLSAVLTRLAESNTYPHAS
ncbi:MAG: hypothetical protein ACI9U2_002544, partial [Bradymonadia bacterium]